ncbi:MAG: hypothetical protein CME63_17495 [Halobacteriovoraceae bacterium]|nr:hypothetical protein [Halobacteriovoraceae bacterium]|tara:strand:+ start:15727 stop:17094 length:1368 start_codon:yes stop_codon:yes gene_type:complete
MKALFVCDEKEEWNLLRNLFHAHLKNLELICVMRGNDALDTLSYEGPFGAIIIECSLKDTNPSDLAEMIFDQTGPRPIIFVGTPTMIKDRVKEEFYNEYDMVSIYNKPYQANQFIGVVAEAISWAKKEEYENSIVELDPENFVPLKLRNFYLYDSVPFDVYVELTKTKFIKAISADKKYTQSAIQDFQKRNIRYLYLEKNEHLSFLENSILKISKSLDLKTLEDKKRIQTCIAAVLVIHQYIRDVGISDTIRGLIKKVIEQFPLIVQSYKDLDKILFNFPSEHNDLAEQAVLKGIICEYISQHLGWKSDMTRSKFGLAALIHDAFLEREEWSTITYRDHPDLDYLSAEQVDNFIEHPKRAAEIARQFTHYPETDFIIEEHHELPDGNGFPQGLLANKITKISATFILANNFVIQLMLSGISRSSVINITKGFKPIYSIGNFKEPYQVIYNGVKQI